MTGQKLRKVGQSGRPSTATRKTWPSDVAPGRTFTRKTWPPRGRGRGESLTSARRIAAKRRAVEVIQLRTQGHTWKQIALVTGFQTPSGAYRAYWRMMDRANWDAAQKQRV